MRNKDIAHGKAAKPLLSDTLKDVPQPMEVISVHGVTHLGSWIHLNMALGLNVALFFSDLRTFTGSSYCLWGPCSLEMQNPAPGKELEWKDSNKYENGNVWRKMKLFYYNTECCMVKKKPIIWKNDGLPYVEELCFLTNTCWILGAALVRIFCFEIIKLEKFNETRTLYKINECIL